MALGALVVACATAACTHGSAGSAGARPVARSRAAAAYTRGCGQAVGGTLPARWRRSGVVLGSLALYSFGQVTDRGRTSRLVASTLTPGREVKLLALVRPGAVVTLTVPPAERRVISLAYRPGVIPSAMAGGDAAVTFHACASQPGEQPGFPGWTQFNGGIVVAGARCARLVVASPGSVPASMVLAFGRRSCG